VNILSNILPFLEGITTITNKDYFSRIDAIKNGGDGSDSPPKLALFSAHDDTILPLLATLGNNVFDGKEWAPYASVFNIELHDIQDPTGDILDFYPSKKAFRLILNGKVLTNTVDRCPSDLELCDISILIDQVLPFAINERDCAPRKATEREEDSCQLVSSFATLEGVAILMTLTIVCGCIGALTTFVVMTRRLPLQLGRHHDGQNKDYNHFEGDQNASKDLDNNSASDGGVLNHKKLPLSSGQTYSSIEIS